MKPARLPPTIHTLVMLGSLVLSFLFVQLPSLSRYSLQAIAVATLAFFLLKLANKQKIHHFIPQYASFEVALVTFIFSLLIGATGNTNSIFYPLTYIYLFLLVFSTYTQAAIMTTLGFMLYQYLLMPGATTYIDIFDLVSIPIVLTFFIFTKQQHEELIKEHKQLKAGDQVVNELEAKTQSLAGQLAIVQQELNSSQIKLQQLQQTLIQLNQELDRLLDQAKDERQRRQVIRLQVIIEEKLKQNF